ncbi:MAG: domain, G-beta repeat [Verrucomicrobiaceae bacterium]|nr:domain, G-beta repeat [Verrucomicrobiaceae bacterium]
MSARPPLFLALLLSTAVTCPGHAGELDFYRDVFPFLKTNCISCHNKTTTKAHLNMETPELIAKGGETGPGLVPGNSAESLIVQASKHTDDLEMPPKNNKSGAVDLSAAQLQVLKTWIDKGAKSSVQEEREVVWQPLAPGVHPIYSVAMTQDGRFAACGRSNQISVYDLATRQFLTQIVDGTQKTGTAHRALVQSLAFSPDGTRLASGSFREVKIWRQEPGKTATRKADPSLGLALSVPTSDGRQIIAADKTGALLVLEAASGKLIRKCADVDKAGIRLLAVSPDAALAAVYGADETLSVWNLADGKPLGAKADLPGVHAMAWMGDGKALATAGEDKIVRVWTLPATPEEGSTSGLVLAKELKGASAPIKAMAAGASPDVLFSLSEAGKIQGWSVAEARVTNEIPAAGAACLCVSPDGGQLAIAAADGAVRVMEAKTGKLVSELRGSLSATRQAAAQEWTIAAQGLEQTYQKAVVDRIDAQTKALDELLKKANETIVSVKKLLPEKQKALQPVTAARAAAQKVLDEVVAQIAKAPAAKPDAALETQQTSAQEKLAAAALAETSALAACSAVENNEKDAEAEVKRITEAKTQNSADVALAKAAMELAKKAQAKATADLATARQGLAKADRKPLAVAFSKDAQRVAAVFSDGSLHGWAMATGLPVEQVTGTTATSASVLATGGGSFVACTGDGAVTTSSAPPRWVLERVLGGDKDRHRFADRVNAVRFSPDGKTLATGGGEPSRSGDIIVFDIATGKPVKTWKERHEDTVLCLDFSPDGRLLASGGADKIARVSELATGKQVNVFESHTHHVMGVAFRADGRVLATAGADGVVISWDMTLGERKKKIEGWTKEVTSLQFIGATNHLITSAGDNLVRVVDDEGAEVRAIAKLPDFMQSAASTASGGTFIGGGEDSVLRVWDGTNGKEVAMFGAK